MSSTVFYATETFSDRAEARYALYVEYEVCCQLMDAQSIRPCMEEYDNIETSSEKGVGRQKVFHGRGSKVVEIRFGIMHVNVLRPSSERSRAV